MKGNGVMWTSVYMARSREKAEVLRNAIEEKNIIVMLRCSRVPDKAVEDCYEILVPAAELEEALDIIIDE